MKTGNRAVRSQIERGVFDINAIKLANQKLIDTIEESLQIADEGKANRKSALKELQLCEDQLRKTLAAAKAPEK